MRWGIPSLIKAHCMDSKRLRTCRKRLHTYQDMSPRPNRCPECNRDWQKTEKGKARKIRFYSKHPNYSGLHSKTKGFSYQKIWKSKNKNKINSYTRLRQARIKSTTTEFVDYDLVIAKANGVCQICYEPFDHGKIEIDHIVPLAKNGSHTYNNVQAAHASCNRRKGTT